MDPPTYPFEETSFMNGPKSCAKNFFLNGKYVGSIAIILLWVMITTHADKEKYTFLDRVPTFLIK